MLISFVNLYVRRHTRRSGRVLMYCLATFEFVLVVFLMFPFLINVEWRFNSEDWTHKTIIAVKMTNASSHSNIMLTEKRVKTNTSWKGEMNGTQRDDKTERRMLRRGTKSPQTVHQAGHSVSCCIQSIQQ